MALSNRPAERHRQVSRGFTDRVRGARSWDAPAPVAGWTARDVVRHLTEWLPAFLATDSDIRLPAGPSVDDDPAAAWQTHCDAVQSLLDDPATAGRLLSNPHIGELPLDRAIDQFYTADVFMHTWDLARATGQDERLDDHAVTVAWTWMEPAGENLRASGAFGPPVEPPAGADTQTKLICFLGRRV